MRIVKNKYFAALLIFIAVMSWYFVYVSHWISSELESSKTINSFPVESSEKVKVNLTINKGKSFEVELPAGSDQCEVLKKALEQGKIDSLDMRYSEQFQTNSVYLIDGVGKGTEVWWVYKINGKDADKGCSQIKVNNGEKIEWEFVGG